MKIIVNGHNTKEAVEIKCRPCGSVLEVQRTDVKRTEDGAYVFECAVCKREIWIALTAIWRPKD